MVKGNFFTMDALMAALLLMMGLFALSVIPAGEKEIISEDVLTKDLLNTLSAVNVSEINDVTIQAWISDGTIARPENSILVQAGEFWAADENDKATYLLETFLNGTFSNNEYYGLRVTIATEVLFNKNTTTQSDANNILTSRRMITGVEKGEAITGNTASAFLRKVRDKRTSKFTYFGGFVGQGNITSYIRDMPSDVTSNDIIQILVEADSGRDFEILINDVLCDSLSINTGELEPDAWDITHCNSSITTGDNKFTIMFDDFNDAYFAGGFIKLSYLTDEFKENSTYGISRYEFPGINGIVNLFDSFYVPGELNSMTIYLHYLADHTSSNNTFYLKIGNDTVYSDTNTTTEQSITLSNAVLQTMLNYSEFNTTTIPLRLGFENLTYSVEYTGVADVMLLTDISGSMGDEMGSSSSGNIINDCTDPNINDSDTARISVARCLDKQFVSNILNISGNLIGLVSYDTTTDDVEPLTNNQTLLNSVIDTYVDEDYTCICCGINSAKAELINNLATTTIISAGEEWNFTNESLRSFPDNDPTNSTWYSLSYSNETQWHSGNAILGHDILGTGIAITTDMGSGSSGIKTNVYLDEPVGDQATPIIEFTNGYTTTANTFGIGAGDDGWDWDTQNGNGPFGYDDNVDYNGVSGAELSLDFRTGSPSRNRCNNYDCSGAYGITVRMNSSLYNILNANGTASIKFDYEWEGNDWPFEDSDEIFIKAQWISPTTGEHYLGTELSSSGSDNTLEVARGNNPDVDFSGTHEQDITGWIEASGDYYLVLGGRLRSSESAEWGEITFDNILINVSNGTDNYFLRKHFTMSSSDLDDARRGFINLMAEDFATVYLNGQQVYSATPEWAGTYWDAPGIPIAGSQFREGDNVIAVHLQRRGSDGRFDLELIGANNTRTGAMMVMTDGRANRECNGAGEQINSPDLDGNGVSDEPEDDAIQAACDAAEQYGIKSYAVGFSTEADETTLEKISICGNGNYLRSANSSEIGVFYQDTAIEIAEVSRQSQTIVVSSGTPSESILYPDSYISLNITPDYDNSTPDEISVTFQSDQFVNCTDNITIFPGMRVVDAVVTSYSGPHWTNNVNIDGIEVFNLSTYSSNYILLGDPYIVQIPPSQLTPGTHEISITNGDFPNDQNVTCSQNNSLIYTAMITSSTERSEVVEFADGCFWDIEFEDGTNITEAIPSTYTGNNTCSYTNTSINYNSVDAYDTATYEILNNLDFDNDGRVFLNIDTEDLEIIVTLVSEVPYLWGPAVIQTEVWS